MSVPTCPAAASQGMAGEWSALIRARSSGLSTPEEHLRAAVARGLPSHLRPHVWMAFSGAREAMERQPGLYAERLKSAAAGETQSGPRVQIEKDLPRSGCEPGLLPSLRRVLLALNEHAPSAAYVQGQNLVGAALLLVLGEEEAFWLLSLVLADFLPDHYTAPMAGVIRDARVLNSLMSDQLPTLAKQLHDLEIPAEVLAPRWFLSLWSSHLPPDALLRVYDALFTLGPHMIFNIALACCHVSSPSPAPTAAFPT